MVMAISSNFGETKLIIHESNQEEVILPGRFNLVEDAARFNGAMMRPPKECTLGKLL